MAGAALVAGLLVGAVACSSPEDGGSASGSGLSPGSTGVGDSTAAAAPADLYAGACDGALDVGPAVDLPEVLAEVSGLAPSSERGDVVWAIGDGGSAASVYAVDLGGNLIATVALSGVDNNDWEDLAAGPAIDGSGETWLYVADIGDNSSERERIRIQAFPEPSLSETAVSPRTIIANYATGATDAEALAVTADGFWIVGKEWNGDAAPLLHLGFDALGAGQGSMDVPAVFEPTGAEVDTGGDLVTAMDAAPATGVLAVRSYGTVRLFDQATADLRAVVETAPCTAPPIVEVQGESIALLRDGRSFVTASEARPERPAELHVVTTR